MRIRTIKPEFWASESMHGLDDFTLLLAIGLLNYADDEGYFNANPALIRAALFPLRDEYRTITVSLRHLSKRGYIQLFDGADGRKYGFVTKFVENQVINKLKASKIKELCVAPAPIPDEYGTSTVAVPSGMEQGMEQGTGNGALGSSDESSPTSDDSEWLTSLRENSGYAGIDVDREYAKAQAWCDANRKQLTRRRFVNWLNRVDKPMGAAANPADDGNAGILYAGMKQSQLREMGVA